MYLFILNSAKIEQQNTFNIQKLKEEKETKEPIKQMHISFVFFFFPAKCQN